MIPLRNLVLITLDDREETTESGIFIVKQWEDAIDTGTVKAIGEECVYVTPGDRIRFNPYATHPTLEENQRLIKESDILACLT